jgi:hypothetical protein
MLRGDFAGVGWPSARGELQFDARKAFAEYLFETLSQFGAGRYARDDLAFFLRRISALFPFQLPRGFGFSSGQLGW